MYEHRAAAADRTLLFQNTHLQAHVIHTSALQTSLAGLGCRYKTWTTDFFTPPFIPFHPKSFYQKSQGKELCGLVPLVP